MGWDAGIATWWCGRSCQAISAIAFRCTWDTKEVVGSLWIRHGSMVNTGCLMSTENQNLLLPKKRPFFFVKFFLMFFPPQKSGEQVFFWKKNKSKVSNKNLPSVFSVHRFFKPKVTPPRRAKPEARPAAPPVLSTLGGLELRNYGEAVLAASDT